MNKTTVFIVLIFSLVFFSCTKKKRLLLDEGNYQVELKLNYPSDSSSLINRVFIGPIIKGSYIKFYSSEFDDYIYLELVRDKSELGIFSNGTSEYLGHSLNSYHIIENSKNSLSLEFTTISVTDNTHLGGSLSLKRIDL